MAANPAVYPMQDEEEARTAWGVNEPHPLSEDEISEILSSEIADAIGATFDGSVVSDEREENLKFYKGEKFGNEVEGQSQVVLSDVQDTIEWAMPALIRMLVGSPEVARYTPVKPGEAARQQAKAATAYASTLLERNRGFRFFYDWFKSPLISRNVIARVAVEERSEPVYETIGGVNEIELTALATTPGIEVLSAEPDPITVQLPQGPQEIPGFKVETRRMRTTKRLRLDVIPPERTLYPQHSHAVDDDIPFIGFRREARISDLIAWGIDRETALNLPSYEANDWNTEEIERYSDESLFPNSRYRQDAASRRIWLTECWAHIDADGDGFSELRHFICADAGGATVKILVNERANFLPLVDLVPIPMPHVLLGRSLADLVKDLQLIRSTVVRQMLDNMYQVNNSQKEVVEGMVEIDDLLQARAGGIVRVKGTVGQVKPIVTEPFGPMAFELLGFLEGQKDNRTGISRTTQGIDASALSGSTAYAANQMASAAAAKLELIGRVYADGVKQFFKILLRTIVESGMAPMAAEISGEMVEVDPTTFDVDSDVHIEVGLGSGRAAERIAFLGQVMTIQKELQAQGFGGYMVTPQNFFMAAVEMTKAMGFLQTDAFFTDPGDKPPPPPPPSEKVQIEQLRSQGEAEKTKATQRATDVDALREQSLAEYRIMELREQMIFEREKLAAQLAFDRERIELERQTELEVARIQANARAEAQAERAESPGGE